MAQTLPLDIYHLLEDRIGREQADKVASAIEIGFDLIEKRADAVVLQKKLELREELTHELVTKSDLRLTESGLEAKIDALNQKLNFMIVLMLLALTLMSPVVADIIKGALR